MSESIMQAFSFEGLHIRTIDRDGEVWFVGNDIAAVLGYSETSKAIRTHCKGVSEVATPTAGGIQTVKIIPERDVYRLIMRSHLPYAERFEEWVVGEVLPAIRKHGGYLTPQLTAQAMTDADALIPLLKASAAQLEALQLQCREQQRQIAKSAPLAQYADTVLQSNSLHTVNEIAVHLGTTAVMLNRWLAARSYIYRQGDIWMPAAKIRDQGLCDMHVFPYVASDGVTIKSRQLLKWTEKGRKFITEKYEAERI